MKRSLIISLFFLFIFMTLFLVSCNGCSCGGCSCDSLTVDKYDSKKDETPDETVTLSGCHVSNDCIDCYWLPTACGNYENDLGGVSCVGCGWDWTFLECYGVSSLKDNDDDKSKIDRANNVETRKPVLAEEGVHYTVDKVTISVYNGDFESLFDDNWDFEEDVGSLIAVLSMLGEDARILYTVEYTALTELCGVVLIGEIIYDGYKWSSDTDGFEIIQGNAYNMEYHQKKLNLQPGRHVIRGGYSLDFYELKDIAEICNPELIAYVYVEE